MLADGTRPDFRRSRIPSIPRARDLRKRQFCHQPARPVTARFRWGVLSEHAGVRFCCWCSCCWVGLGAASGPGGACLFMMAGRRVRGVRLDRSPSSAPRSVATGMSASGAEAGDPLHLDTTVSLGSSRTSGRALLRPNPTAHLAGVQERSVMLLHRSAAPRHARPRRRVLVVGLLGGVAGAALGVPLPVTSL